MNGCYLMVDAVEIAAGRIMEMLEEDLLTLQPDDQERLLKDLLQSLKIKMAEGSFALDFKDADLKLEV